MMIARILYYYFKTTYLKNRLKNSEVLRHYQDICLKKLTNDALKYSPFYQPYLDKPFHQWPIINKKIMMEQFDEINTVNIKKEQALEIALKAERTRDFSPMIKNIAVGLSSGTSGNRGLFLASGKERDAWAGIMLAKAMPKGIWTKERIAFFLRANNRLYATLNKSKTIQFYFFDLLADFEAHIQRLNRIQPTILSAPASVLRMLARQKQRLTIKPKKIFSVAEVLEQEEEEQLSHYFDCKISQIYQCTEGFLAISDKKTNHLRMNEEFLIIEKEWLDEKRFVPVVTDLLRTTQPIIRYRLDDVLVVKESTSGFTELSAIEGRLGDVCFAKRKNEEIPLFADVIRQQMASSGVDFEDYRICQHDLKQFSIQVYPDVRDKEALIEHLNQLFIHKNCEIPQWSWQAFNPYEPGVKRRRIVSLVNKAK
ncbi:F390 synthetase-related protein [Legionella nagasakiensis]|uniref:F390 synthetase-related protein n=1 Tax=Legionella nagasakiensis TaxID=535290 RepID=UPI001F5EA2C0|nr:F390 synthetase-related protein [Legionella nagasakiensis]